MRRAIATAALLMASASTVAGVSGITVAQARGYITTLGEVWLNPPPGVDPLDGEGLPPFGINPEKRCRLLSTGSFGFELGMKVKQHEEVYFVIDFDRDLSNDSWLKATDFDPPLSEWVPGHWRSVFWSTIPVPYANTGWHSWSIVRGTPPVNWANSTVITDGCVIVPGKNEND